jgi:hypothetical protein
VKSSGIIHENMCGPPTYSSDLSGTNPNEMWLCIRRQFERSGVFVCPRSSYQFQTSSILYHPLGRSRGGVPLRLSNVAFQKERSGSERSLRTAKWLNESCANFIVFSKNLNPFLMFGSVHLADSFAERHFYRLYRSDI